MIPLLIPALKLVLMYQKEQNKDSTLLLMNAKFAIVPHRILKLRDKDLAIMSEKSNAWCVVEEGDIEIIQKYLTIAYADSVDKLPESIQSLWEAGLLLFNGHTYADSYPKSENFPSSLLLKLTGACNISCTYCYDYDLQRWKTNLSFEKIKSTIDYLLSKRDTLGVVFHGGEPLLRFDTIVQTVEYVLQKVSDPGKVKFQLQTNGFLLTDKIIDFLNKHHFSVGLSIDGITEESNRLRVKHSGKSIIPNFKKLFEKYADFIKNRCGLLAVVSKSNVQELPSFALWLQERGINNLSLSFLDLSGKGSLVPEEKVTPLEAVALYREFMDMIRTKQIWELNFSPLISRISNLFQFVPKDFCHKGPCAASSEFLVLDSEENFRTCDCVYDPFFVIGKDITDVASSKARKNITDRYKWLQTDSLSCSTCSLLSLCGGTCVAKAIASNKDPYSIDHVECALSKYIFPELLEEFVYADSKPLFDYYRYHQKH